MPFWIQTSSPTPVNATGVTDEDLSEAIETCFPMETERAFICWDGVNMPLCYKYDVSVIIDAVVPMLQVLLAREEGVARVVLGSDTFDGQWLLEWDKEDLTITPTWESVSVITPMVRENCKKLEMRKDLFLAEWKGLLRKVIDGIRASGVRIRAEDEFAELLRLESAIDGMGRLYRGSE